MIPGISIAQNLVSNPSFECGEDQCGAFQNAADFAKSACNWSYPSTGTTDIFSTKVTLKECYTAMPYQGQPHDHVGSQRPRNGNRFAGIYSYAGGLWLPDEYREYLQTELKEKLVPGETYCTEMYLSRAEVPKFANNNMGMRFNEGPISVDSYNPLLLQPQILEKDIITDTANWVRVGGTFVATSAADHLIIGNFFHDNETSGLVMTSSNAIPYSYYFVDDVSVEQLPHSQFVFSGDREICKGSEATLVASVGSNFITWTTLKDTSKVIGFGSSFEVKPDSTISYRVKAKGCGRTVIDTVSVSVTPLPKVELGKDTTLCKGINFELDAGPDHAKYTWQGEKGGEFYTVTKPGKYAVEVINSFNCRASDDITIEFDDAPAINLGKDTVVCKDFYPLNVGGNEYSYTWSEGGNGMNFMPTQAGIYWVDASNHCGVTRDSIRIYSFDDVFLPNVVTVNQDGFNEHFQIGIKTDTKKLITALGIGATIKIFNRWGGEVYASNKYNNDWPKEEDDVPPGTYYYTITFFDCRSYKGWVQVIR